MTSDLLFVDFVPSLGFKRVIFSSVCLFCMLSVKFFAPEGDKPVNFFIMGSLGFTISSLELLLLKSTFTDLSFPHGFLSHTFPD